jgi:hypothetical protein
MKFNWKSFLLAPLLVPLLYSLALISFTDSRNPLLGMFVLFVVGSVVSYGVALLLFLPCLHLLSKFTALTLRLTSAVGVMLGAATYVAYARQAFQASGFNSGPPQDRFADYLWHDLSDPVNRAWFPVGGLITAAAYWMLAGKPPGDGASADAAAVADFTRILGEALDEAGAAGLAGPAERAREQCFAACTTSSERLGEVGSAVSALLRDHGAALPAPTRAKLKTCLSEAAKVWPKYRPR